MHADLYTVIKYHLFDIETGSSIVTGRKVQINLYKWNHELLARNRKWIFGLLHEWPLAQAQAFSFFPLSAYWYLEICL